MPPSTGYASASFTPASDVDDPSVLVDLANMPAGSGEFWDSNDSSDGTRGQIWDSGGSSRYACDFIEFDDVGDTGHVRFRPAPSGTLTAAGGPYTYRVYPPNTGNTAEGPTDTYGSDAAYDSGFEGYYPTGGGTDRTGNSLDFTGQGSVTEGGATGLVGTATQYDGTDDYFLLSAGFPIFGSAARTIIFVEKGTVTNDRLFTIDTTGGAGERWTVRNENDTLRIEIQGSGYTSSLACGNATNWTHCACRLDSTTLADHDLFSNGSKESATGTNSVNTGGGSSANATIGGGTSNLMTGYLDDFQIHSVARADAYIAHEYAQVSDNATFWGTWTWNAAGGGGANPKGVFGLALDGPFRRAVYA